MVLKSGAPHAAGAFGLACFLALFVFRASTQADSTPAAAEAHFDVHEYRVLGNSKLSNREIERVLYPLLGDHKTLADVEVARAALEKAYHDTGYQTVFVDIPEQDVGDAIVRLHVTEGKLHEVSIGGARYFSERKILAALPAAKAGTVPSIPELQQQLAAVNAQSADRSVVPVLKAGPTPGTVDLSIKVDDHLPLHGSIDFNNQYSPDTKPLRATVALSYDNLFQRLDSLSLQYQVSPQEWSQVSVVAANYAFGPIPDGLRPSVYYIHSNSNAATIGTIGVLGKGDIFGTRVSYPFFESASSTQSLVFGADYKHFDNIIGLASMPALDTPISYSLGTLGYAGSWTGAWLQEVSSVAANFGVRRAPNNADTFANDCFKCQPNFFYLRGDETIFVKLPFGMKLQVRAAGQWAEEPLINNENYSIAGADGVRGYLEAEVLGDAAIKGTVQLYSPTWVVRGASLLNGFLYYDLARADIIDAVGTQPSVTRLRSAGAGWVLFPGRSVTGAFTWAYPLTDGPRTLTGQSRILFDVKGSF
jgi:hemolysin activation/secretion protein